MFRMSAHARISVEDALTKRNELQIQASLARHDRYYADHFNKARKKAKYVNGLKSKTRYW